MAVLSPVIGEALLTPPPRTQVIGGALLTPPPFPRRKAGEGGTLFDFRHPRQRSGKRDLHVAVEGPGRPHRERRDGAVQHRAVLHALAGPPLDVDDQQPVAGQHRGVPAELEGKGHVLVVEEDGRGGPELRLHFPGVHLRECAVCASLGGCGCRPPPPPTHTQTDHSPPPPPTHTRAQRALVGIPGEGHCGISLSAHGMWVYAGGGADGPAGPGTRRGPDDINMMSQFGKPPGADMMGTTRGVADVLHCVGGPLHLRGRGGALCCRRASGGCIREALLLGDVVWRLGVWYLCAASVVQGLWLFVDVPCHASNARHHLRHGLRMYINRHHHCSLSWALSYFSLHTAGPCMQAEVLMAQS